MNLWQRRYRAWIVPYAEGTLDARRRARLEAWLAQDPVLAAEAEAERRVVARLREAAQSDGVVAGEKNLWPGIQSRLEPRRSLVRPLILVGGLSAAATSLAWAMLWGPLGHPAPPPPVVVVSKSDAPNVLVVETVAGHRYKHPVRRSHHGGVALAKRPVAPPLVPGAATKRRAQDDRLLARNETPTPGDGGGPSPTTPRFVPGNAAPVHLATNVRPAAHAESQDSAPIPADGDAASGDAANQNNSPASDGDNSAPTQDGTTDATALKPLAADRPMPVQRSRRSHHRHSRHTHMTKTPANTPSAPASPEAATPARGTDVPPKTGSKPVD